jgi:hypothetical protein
MMIEKHSYDPGRCKRMIIDTLSRYGSMTPLELHVATGYSRGRIGDILNEYPEFEKDPDIPSTGKRSSPTYWRLAGHTSHRQWQIVKAIEVEPELPAPMPVPVDPAVASMVNDQVAIARSIGVLARHGDAALTSAMLVRWQQKRSQIQRSLGIRVDNEVETNVCEVER